MPVTAQPALRSHLYQLPSPSLTRLGLSLLCPTAECLLPRSPVGFFSSRKVRKIEVENVPAVLTSRQKE